VTVLHDFRRSVFRLLSQVYVQPLLFIVSFTGLIEGRQMDGGANGAALGARRSACANSGHALMLTPSQTDRSLR
jgi:hypothetical protein